ncbi:MAG: CYTH domain-containing protein [Bacteroidota bacterium]
MADSKNKETELRFLVKGSSWQSLADKGKAQTIEQAFLSAFYKRVVRIRKKDGKGILTIKGEKTGGSQNPEWEYPIPPQDADEMLAHPGLIDEGSFPISKTRYSLMDPTIQWKGQTLMWEIDVFHDQNEGLILAEIEINDLQSTEEKQEAESVIRNNLPSWIGKELDFEKDSSVKRYFNNSLSKSPYNSWNEADKAEMVHHLSL